MGACAFAVDHYVMIGSKEIILNVFVPLHAHERCNFEGERAAHSNSKKRTMTVTLNGTAVPSVSNSFKIHTRTGLLF